MAGQVVGSIVQDVDGRLQLEYDRQWRVAPSPTPLSLSMPLAVLRHGDELVRSFL